MRRIRTISRLPLFRISSLNGLSVLVKIAIGFVTSKVIAVFIGPSGMALVGNLRNFLASCEGITTLGFQNGIVKYIAETRDDEAARKQVLSTLLICLLGSTLVFSPLLFFLAEFWSTRIFSGELAYASVFRIMAAAMPFYAASVFMLAVINGMGRFRRVMYVNILGNTIGLVVSVLLIWNFRTFGALCAIVLSPALLFFVTWFYLARQLDFSRSFSISGFSASMFRKLLGFSAMTLFSVIFVPMTYLAIRKAAIAGFGQEAAGNWEAMNRISSYYLLFVTTLVSVYFLPRLAVAASNRDLHRVFRSYFRGILPLFGLGLLVLYFLRSVVVRLLFTSEFDLTRDLFLWQLVGDFFKAASLLLGYCLIARRNTRAFLVSEAISLFVLYVTSRYFLDKAGVVGLSWAHAITYVFYTLMLVAYFRKPIFYGSNRK